MADIQANIGIGVDTTQALASIRQLQREISAVQASTTGQMKAADADSRRTRQNLVSKVNLTEHFSASMEKVSSSTERFSNALEKNQLSMAHHFRAMGERSGKFQKLFRKDFDSVSRLAQERVKDLQTQYVNMGREANGALRAIKVRPLALDMENLGTKVQLAAQKHQIFSKMIKQGSTDLLNFGKNTQWAGRQLMMGFTLPLVIFGATAVKEFKKIEEQAVKFKRVYGDMFNTNAETEKALGNVRELAEEFTKYGIAVEKTIGLAAKAAQMGNTGAALTAQVTEATRLAVLGGIEQEEALDTTISLTNAFGIATEDLAGKIDFLNAAENQTILAIEDFNTAIPLSGSVVKQLGGDVEDLAVLLTAMREGGINASQAGNALKSSLARLIAPSRNAKETLSGFGIDVLGIVDNNAGNLMGTINTLAHSLNELDPLSRAKAIESLFGKFQFARMSTLFSNIVREGSQASKVLGLTANNAAELGILAERELKRVEESPAFKLSKQMEKLQAAMAPIGAEFVKAILPIVELGTKALKAFNNMGEGGKQFLVVATAIGAVALPLLLMSIGLVANAFGNLVGGFQNINKFFRLLSGSSTILGGQTEYMTQQQIEAASVAASLGQSHSNLTQVFTAEASAVANLITQYRAAITQQRQLSIGMTAAGVARRPANAAPKKYASGGIISGPGTGTSDSIVAMLSNGEAVIPAAMVNKYGPMVEQIISDNVPGFFGGRYALPKGRQFGHMDGGFGVEASTLSQFPEGSKARRSGDMFGNSGFGGRNVNAKSSWGRGQDPQLNRASATGAASFAAQRADFASGGASDFLPSVAEAGFDPGNANIAQDVQEYQDAFMELFDKAGKAGAKFVADTEAALAAKKQRVEERLGTAFDDKKFNKENISIESIDKETAKRRAGTPTAKARQVGLGTVKEFRPTTLTKQEESAILATGNKEDIASMNAYYKRSDKKTNRGAQIEVPKRDKAIAQKVKGNLAQIEKEAEQDVAKIARSTADGFTGSLKEGFEIKSPSRKMWRIGRAIVDGTVGGAKESLKKLKGKTMQVGQGIGNKIGASPTAQGAANYLNGYDLDKKKDARAAKATSNAAKATEESTEAIDDLADITKEKADGDKSFLKEQKRQRRAKNSGIAFTALGTATMIAGMATQADGIVGEIAQKAIGPMAALSGIAPMLMAMPPALTTLVVVAGIVATALLYLNNRFGKLQDKSMELTEALGAGAKSVRSFAEASGKASAGEIMDKKRENAFGVFQIQAGKNTFGNSFLGSEPGQEFKGSVKESLKTRGLQGTQEQVVSQLGTAVAAGSLTTEQARSIVASLAKELQDYSFGISVNASLTELLGPSGENLLENPLLLRVSLIEETQKDLEGFSNTLSEEINLGVTNGLSQGEFVSSAASLGAGIGGAIGTMVLPGVGTAIGAGVGAIAGGLSSYLGTSGDFERAAESTGASVATAKIALQQQQEMLDSLDLEYEQRIQVATAAGDLAKVEELTNDRIQDRATLLLENAKTIGMIRDSYSQVDSGVRAALDSGVEKSMASQYKGTVYEDVVPETQNVIESKVKDKELQYVLKMQVASGEVNPLQMTNFLNKFEGGTLENTAMVNVMTNMGGTFSGQTMALMNLLVDKDGKPIKDLQSSVLLEISNAGSPQETEELQRFYQQLTQTDVVLDREAKFRFILENPEEALGLKNTLAEIESYSGEVTLDVVANIAGQEAVDTLVSDMEYWSGLNNVQKKIYLQTLVATISTVSTDDPALDSWLGSEGSAYENSPPGEKLAAYANYNARIVTAISADTTDTGDGTPAETSGGGGAEKSVDSLLKKLRDLRIATIDMKKGWEGMREVLAKTFAGDGGGIDIFDGLSNQIRKMGVGENLIEMIVGMDPDEYESRKNELFTFDNAGNITGTTSKLKNLSSAFNSIAIGEYVNSQQAFIENTKNQFNAMNTLVASGMSLAESYELVQDEALAAAIAMGATSAEIKEIIRITSLMKEQQERSKKEQERIDASKAVKETNKEFNNQIVILNKLAKAKGQYSDEEIQAILGDSNLGKLFLDPSIDPQSLKKALENARRRADLELKIKVSTDEGKEGLFNELVSEISNEFSKQETKIQLEFDVSTKDDSDIAKQAQNQIAEIQYQLDDYNAELEQISWVEDDINEKYDKRAEALEDIARANGKIAAQQKAQLSIADALSQGDISGAARAAQELKEQQAGSAQEDQKAMLDRAREAELASARAPGGMSRADIEDEITALERKRFLIEEQSLEPAQERIRIAEHNKELQIAALEVSGKTRSEWEQISSQVDIATQNTEEFAKSVERALALFEYFVNGALLDVDLFGGELTAELEKLGVNVGLEKQASALMNDYVNSGNGQPANGASSAGPRTGGSEGTDLAKMYDAAGIDWRAKAKEVNEANARRRASEKQSRVLYSSSNPSSGAGSSSSRANTQQLANQSVERAVNTAISSPSASSAARAKAAAMVAAQVKKTGNYSTSYLYGNSGGNVPKYNIGGRVKGYAAGGYSMGSDIVPAMLTPGEFVVRKRAVQNFGMDNLEKINSGSYADGSVYTYNLAVNVNSESDPSRIARAVMTQIKQVDSQRIRNNKL